MKLTSFCVAAPVCTTSRAALLTGSYPKRVTERGNVKHIHPVLHEKEITAAEVVKQEDYATAMIGKWNSPVTPTQPTIRTCFRLRKASICTLALQRATIQTSTRFSYTTAR